MDYFKRPILNNQLFVPIVFIFISWSIAGLFFLFAFFFWVEDLHNPYPSMSNVVFIFLGYLCLFLSIPWIVYIYFYLKKISFLRTCGFQIICKNFFVDRTMFSIATGMSGYRIGINYNNKDYFSDIFLIDPSPYLLGKEISLYIDKKNSKKYIVDIEDIVREGVRKKYTKKNN